MPGLDKGIWSVVIDPVTDDEVSKARAACERNAGDSHELVMFWSMLAVGPVPA